MGVKRCKALFKKKLYRFSIEPRKGINEFFVEASR